MLEASSNDQHAREKSGQDAQQGTPACCCVTDIMGLTPVLNGPSPTEEAPRVQKKEKVYLLFTLEPLSFPVCSGIRAGRVDTNTYIEPR